MGGYIERISGEIADILLREGVDYTQTKAVFKAAREKAGTCVAVWQNGRRRAIVKGRGDGKRSPTWP